MSSGTFKGVWEAVGSGDAPTSAGGGIRFTGSVRRSFTHDVSLSSYRYVRLHIAPPTDEDAPAPNLQIGIGGKTFPVRRVGTSDYWFVDLCAETNGPQVSAAGSKWLLQRHYFPAIVSDELPRYEKSYLGVGRCKSFTLTASKSETEVTILRVELSRRGFYDKDTVSAAPPTVTFCPPFYRGRLIYRRGPDFPPTDLDRMWPTREYETRYFGGGYEQPPDDGALREDLSGSVDEDDGYEDSREGEDNVPETPNRTRYWARRFLLAHVSGRQGLEEKDSSCQVTETENSFAISWSQSSVKDLVDSVKQTNANGVLVNPGWTATDNKPAPTSGCDVALPDFESCYLNSDRPATWLFGGGAMAAGGEGQFGVEPTAEMGWQYGFDRPLGSYDAQQMFDVIDGFPGCGDFFGFGGGDGKTLILRAAGILRGNAQGLTISTAKKAASGKTVELRQGEPSPGALVSSGLSGVDGLYVMHDAPFAKTVQPALAKTGNLTAGFKAYGRKRQRIVFVVPTDKTLGKGLTGDASIASRMVRGYTADDLLMLEFAKNTTAQEWEEVETALTAYRPCVRYSRLNGYLYASFQTAETGGAIGAAWTSTEGRSFDGMATINSTGQFPTFCIQQSGLQCHFWRTDEGAIQSKIVSPDLAHVFPLGGGLLTPVASNVAEDTITSWVEHATQRVYLAFRLEDGTLQTIYSVDGGHNYPYTPPPIAPGEDDGFGIDENMVM